MGLTRVVAAFALIGGTIAAVACSSSDKPPADQDETPASDADAAPVSGDAAGGGYDACSRPAPVAEGTCECTYGMFTYPCGIGLCRSLDNTEGYCTPHGQLIIYPGCPNLADAGIDGGPYDPCVPAAQ